jgi:hypothetical protein
MLDVHIDTSLFDKMNEKISFELKEETTNEIVLIGQIMIVDENEVVQDYSKKTNLKYSR